MMEAEGREVPPCEPDHDKNDAAPLRVAEPERGADQTECDDPLDVGGSAGDGTQLNR